MDIGIEKFFLQKFGQKKAECKTTKKAFTLAEVLITLGIIGIVAALTLPALISNHRKKVVETRLAKFYSVMNQAIILSESENGDKEYWDPLPNRESTTTAERDLHAGNLLAWYNYYLEKYIDGEQAIAYKHYTHSRVGVYFKDGSVALISGASIIYYPDAKYLKAAQQSNGYIDFTDLKKDVGRYCFTFDFLPNEKDARYTYHYGLGIEPYKVDWDGQEASLWNNASIGCKKNASNEAAYCTAAIQLNGWKIPDNYPFKF